MRDMTQVLAMRDGWTLTREPVSFPLAKYVQFALRGLPVTPGELAAMREFRAPGRHPARGVLNGIEVSWEESELIRNGLDPRSVLWPSLRARVLTDQEMMAA